MYLALRAVGRRNAPGQPDSEVGGVVSALPDDWCRDVDKWRVTHVTGPLTADIGYWPGERSQAVVDATIEGLRKRGRRNPAYAGEWTAERVTVRQDFGRGARKEYAWVRVPDLHPDTLAGLLADDENPATGEKSRRRFRVDPVAFASLHGPRHFDPAEEVAEDDVPTMTESSLLAIVQRDKRNGLPPSAETVRQHGRDRAAAQAARNG